MVQSDPRAFPAHDDELQSGTTAISRRSHEPLGARIRVIGALATPPVFHLTRGTCVVGSGPACDLRISEPTISRVHVELGLVPEGVRVIDLGSRNGTYYQGERIDETTLAHGTQLTLGGVQIALEAFPESLDGGLASETLFRGIVGQSLAMRRLFATLARLDGSLVTVLVTGEAGVGKELVAQALRQGSTLASGPFVVVKCGAIPRDVVATALFGHRNGAFAGANAARRGALESAKDGTLFLDEVADIPLDVQRMLLHAMEAGGVRVGGQDRISTTKLRVIAATSRDLENEVREGRFREDLYERLAAVTLVVPPLRDRMEDIEPLAQRFAEAAGASELPSLVVEQLRQRAWPGNARELRSAVQLYASHGHLPDANGATALSLEACLADLVRVGQPYSAQKEALCDRFTRVYLLALLAHTQGNQSAAARLAGLDRSYLGRLLVKHGLSRS